MSFTERANSKRRVCARQRQLVINQWVIFPDADQHNKFIFGIHCNNSKIEDNNSHTCISSYTYLRAYLTVCIASFAAPEVCVRYAKRRRDPLWNCNLNWLNLLNCCKKNNLYVIMLIFWEKRHVWYWFTIWNYINIHFLPLYLQFCYYSKCILTDWITWKNAL